MGWVTRRGCTMYGIIRDLLRGEENDYTRWRVLDYEVCGEQGKSVLWTATEILHKETREIEKIIVCILLKYHNGNWAYRWLEEGCLPHYYSCPKRIRDAVPARREEWREKCRKWNKENVPC